MIDNKQPLAKEYESLLSKQEKIEIENYVRAKFEDELDYVYSFPRFVFLNGYYYAKVVNMKLSNMDEYMEKPFLKMAKTYIKIDNKRTTELDRFIWRPRRDEMIVRDCFIAGMKAYENENMRLVAS
jgi:hypothetical protein